ncbi:MULTISPECIES: hypothetical protein [unclassified Sphingomonas]|uniref:hypothetical protein n=1 Tax=unclassified Sphingomonas TaxID=196159 RepID=UPI0006F85F48|nr:MULTISPECIES: hypothetical protein [unclassified Sphingomonas]KQX17824.1 hypothetical protein ASD17_19145 [Sphingomonas sp. Root1294]KQY70750.1 hypothetical protein ASD39_23045 [Sphingomonas sp. Root50]KRB91757.1 hypothetical protein ASE22_07265 [Sphingomonas sp. Root720]
MTRLLAAALLFLAAQPALAVPGQPRLPVEKSPPVDRIYPELAIEGEGWRGLLPIMLMNVEQATRARTAGAADTSRETR